MVPGKLRVSEIFVPISKSRRRVSLRHGFSNFWPRGLGVSDFCLLANGFDQNHNKIVYLIKNVR